MIPTRMKTLLFSAVIGLISVCFAMGDGFAEKGGHSFLLRVQQRVDDDGAKIPVTKEELDQAIRVIGKRLERMGAAKPQITRQPEGGILLKVPGVEPGEAGRISAMLEKASRLELREVNARSDEADAEGKILAQRVLDGEEIVPGYRAYILRSEDGDGNDYVRPILINRRIALQGADIADAAPSPQQPDAVLVTLDGAGTEKMIALTRNMRTGLDRIAILLDGEVISAPVLVQVPLGKHFIISGLDEPGEAQALAISLMNPLENPLKVEAVRRIPPAVK